MATKKASKKAVKTAKKSAPKKAAKAAKKATKKTVKKASKKAVKKAAPKKAKKAAKKATPKTAKKAVKKKVRKAAPKKAAPKKSARKKAPAKKAAPKKAAKKASKKGAAPKAGKKAASPKKAAAKKAAPKKAASPKKSSSPKKSAAKKKAGSEQASEKAPDSPKRAAPQPFPEPSRAILRKKPPQRHVERHVLDNGLRVITEKVPGAARVMLSVWVNAGSRYEELNESGVTHLIQRMAFHGAKGLDADEMAKKIDAVGGQVDFETGRDYAAYFALVEPKHLIETFDLMAELTLRPNLTSGALAAESKKLLDELRAAEKEGDFVLDRMFYRSFWKGHGLCRPPKGRLLVSKGQTKLENFKPKAIQRFHQRSHHPLGMTIVAAGDLDHQDLVKHVEARYGELEEPKKKVSTTSPANFKFFALRNRPQFSQIRFRIGVPACPAADSDRHAASLLNAVVGAGAGSRIAQLLRSEELKADEAGSDLAMFADAGCLSVGVRTSRKHAPEAIDTVVAEFRRLITEPISDDELERAKATQKALMMKAVDSLRSRVEDLARTERYFGELVPFDQEIEAMEKVKNSHLRALAANWVAPHFLSLGLLGNLKGVNIRPNALQW